MVSAGAREFLVEHLVARRATLPAEIGRAFPALSGKGNAGRCPGLRGDRDPGSGQEAVAGLHPET